MKELENLTVEELREIIHKVLKKLDKKGEKRTVNYRSILSSCSSKFSRPGGCSRSAGTRRAGRSTDLEKK